MFYSFVRRILFLFDPLTTHDIALGLLRIFFKPAIVKYFQVRVPRVPVSVFGLDFPNPVGLAAGLDVDGDYIDALFGLGFGFIEVGGVTPLPQAGNPRPWLFRIPKARALINRKGFANKGVDYLIEKLKQRKVSGLVGVNIAKNKDTPLEEAVNDYRICIEKLYPYADFITVNLSSPNTPGMRELQTEKYLSDLLNELKKTQKKLQTQYQKKVPLLVKVAPELDESEIQFMASVFLQHQIEGIIATNTSTDHRAVADFSNGNEKGGLSGGPISQRSTQVIALFHQYCEGKIPIIALGGVMSAEDAAVKFEAGAVLVQVLTGLIYEGPGLIRQIIKSKLPHEDRIKI